ncbi:MobV family relaxase [Candidatus Ventrimonas sp. KK005]
MPKQILRIEPIHSSQAFASKWKHNMRLGDIPNADSSKTWKNEQLIRLPVGETYLTYFERKIASLPYYDTHKIRKNGIRGFEVFLSFGQGELPPEFTLGQWKRNSIQFLRDVFGRENVAAATLHMDERAPHIHAIVFPVREGRLRARAFLPDRQAMRDLHVKYHEYTRECGLEPESRYMHIKHEKVGRFYSNINLALEKQLPSPMEGESLEAYAVRADECYKDQMLRSLGREQRIWQLEKEKEALEKANQTMEETIRKSYEARINRILKEIGSVQNARHAIHYRDCLQKAIEWKRGSNPELAASVEQMITNVQQGYEKAVRERERQGEEKQ